MKRYILNEGINIKKLFGLNEANMQKTIRKIMDETVNPVKDAFENAVVKYRGSLDSGRFHNDFYTAVMMEPETYLHTVTEEGENLYDVICGVDAECGTADKTEELFKTLYGKYSESTGIWKNIDICMYFKHVRNAKAAAEEVSGKLCCNIYVFHYVLDHYDRDDYPLYMIDTEAVFYNGREIDGITQDSYKWDGM